MGKPTVGSKPWRSMESFSSLVSISVETSVAKYMAKLEGRRPRLENISQQSCRRHRGECHCSFRPFSVDCGAWHSQIMWLA